MGYIKEKKVNQTCLSAMKVKPTDRYFIQLRPFIYIPVRLSSSFLLSSPSGAHLQCTMITISKDTSVQEQITSILPSKLDLIRKINWFICSHVLNL